MWKIGLLQDSYGQNWIGVIGSTGDVLIWLYPDQLDKAWHMVIWRNDVLRRAQALELARAA